MNSKREREMRTMTIEDIGELLAEKDARIKELEEALGSLDKVQDYFNSCEVETCCSGYECGCMGKPINPEYYLAEVVADAREVAKE